MDTEAREAVRAAFPPFIQDVVQVKKISVLTAISIGTLVSNLVILLTILTKQGKVLFFLDFFNGSQNTDILKILKLF